jgi:hypothetical protein
VNDGTSKGVEARYVGFYRRTLRARCAKKNVTLVVENRATILDLELLSPDTISSAETYSPSSTSQHRDPIWLP